MGNTYYLCGCKVVCRPHRRGDENQKLKVEQVVYCEAHCPTNVREICCKIQEGERAF